MNILSNPVFDICCTVGRLTINNEKYLSCALLAQTFEELKKHIRAKSLFKHHQIILDHKKEVI